MITIRLMGQTAKSPMIVFDIADVIATYSVQDSLSAEDGGIPTDYRHGIMSIQDAYDTIASLKQQGFSECNYIH